MRLKCFMDYTFRSLLLALLILNAPVRTLAAVDMENYVPPGSCGAGWQIEGKLSFYDRETLSDRINGEAELYFPYGFDRMVAARYASGKNSAAGIDLEIYRMGSPLDAFGIYANYKQEGGRSLSVGAESNLSGSQLFLYQGRYFVHLQMTGVDAENPDLLAECSGDVVSRLPGTAKRPQELSVFDRTELLKGTERYLPKNLLGYDFLNRGIVADAVVEGKNSQIFLLLSTTEESASAAFERFRTQSAKVKIAPFRNGAQFLEGVDPLYGPVIVLKKGNCLAGALKFSVKEGISAFLESLCR